MEANDQLRCLGFAIGRTYYRHPARGDVVYVLGDVLAGEVPGRLHFHCTWACWLGHGHVVAGATIHPETGEITGRWEGSAEEKAATASGTC